MKSFAPPLIPAKSPPPKLPTFDEAAAVEPRDALELDEEVVELVELLPKRLTFELRKPELEVDEEELEPDVDAVEELVVLLDELEEEELPPPPPPPPPP